MTMTDMIIPATIVPVIDFKGFIDDSRK